jgi:hypothetical protein
MTLHSETVKSVVISVSCIERVGAHTWNRRCSTCETRYVQKWRPVVIGKRRHECPSLACVHGLHCGRCGV